MASWIISTQNNAVSTLSANRNVSSVEEYKGKARSVFDSKLPSAQISHDFMVILASSQLDGIKFDENHEAELSKQIDNFKKQIDTSPPEKCLEEKFNIHMASVTLRRIEKASDQILPCFLLEISGRLEYTSERNAKILKNSYAIEPPERGTKRNYLPSVPSSSGWGILKRFSNWFGPTSTAPPKGPSYDLARSESVSMNFKWKEHCEVIIGAETDQRTSERLHHPHALAIDPSDDIIYIADTSNHRIFAWKRSEGKGFIAAGGDVSGSDLKHLHGPTDVILDVEKQALLICDSGNKRIMRWPLKGNTSEGESVIDNICCHGLTMDKDRNLYVTDTAKNEVRRYLPMGDKEGKVVAGGHGGGHANNQLNQPSYVAVDNKNNVYVSDSGNCRVMKWNTQATVGIIVAGDGHKDKKLSNLSLPQGIFVTEDGIIYVVEKGNHQVTRWQQGSKEGELIAGGNGGGAKPNQLCFPVGISFDNQQNLYVADGSDAILCFKVETDSSVKSVSDMEQS